MAPMRRPTAPPRGTAALGLVEALVGEWRANAERWEPVASQARELGLEVWNPGLYAAGVHTEYLRRFPPRRGALLGLGLNPGPYGMAQTGIPFTDCRTARKDLGLVLEVPGRAPQDLVKRLRTPRGTWRGTYERSSLGIYAFLRLAWSDMRVAYENWFVGNPCPLLFLDPKKWNVTPADSRLRRLPKIRELRREAVERFASALQPRGIVCLGKDVEEAVGDLAADLVGPDRVVPYPHPARAPPVAWARGLLKELEKRRLK